MKKFFTLLLLLAAYTGFAQVTIYSENVGTPASTTLVNAYAGWQVSSPVTYSSSTTPAQSDVRTSSASTGYTGASGGGNVFLGTSTGNARDFIISGINTSGYTGIQLSFGINTNNTGLFLTVEYSTDGGTTYSPVSFTNPNALGWSLASASTTLPAATNLTLRFSKNNTAQFRVDDIVITGNSAGTPALTAGPAVTGLSATSGSASSPGIYNLSGTNLTGAPGNITVTAPANFEISLSNTTGFTSSTLTVPYTSSTLATTIYVRIAATAPTGPVSGNVTNTGGGANAVNVAVSGLVQNPEPTVQATNVTITNVVNGGFDVSWTNGNGDNRIVVVRQTATAAVAPADGTAYTLPATTGSGNIVVYSGTGAGPVTVTGLVAGTNYTVKVYEANGTNYLTADATGNPATATTTGTSPVLTQANFTSVATPLYMGSGNVSRLPTMFFARVSNLAPSTTYRYIVQATNTSDFGGTNLGAGNPVLIDYTVSPATYTYSTSPSVTVANGYGKFTTDASGNFTGTFGFVYTSNARFTPGNQVYPAIAVAVDNATPVIVNRFALNQFITPLVFATLDTANTGSFIKGASAALPGNVVALWKSTDGNNIVAARPLSMTLAENPTFLGAAWAGSFITGYDQTAGSWNTIIPNDNPEGVRLIQQFDVTGGIVGCNSDADGTWPTGPVSTGDPTNGTAALQISATDAPLNAGACFGILPVKLTSFTAQQLSRTVNVKWTTAQEINSKQFIIERSIAGGAWTAIGTVTAAGSSSVSRAYNFVDLNPGKGVNNYRLRSVDLDNRGVLSEVRSVLFSETYAITVSPNPASDHINVLIAKADQKPTQVIVSDMNGKVVEKHITADNQLSINTTRYSKGVYVIRIITEGNTSTQKVVIQ